MPLEKLILLKYSRNNWFGNKNGRKGCFLLSYPETRDLDLGLKNLF